jgi:hypothetical protein
MCLPEPAHRRWRVGVSWCLLDHFVMELYDILTQDVQHGAAIPRQVIVPAAVRARAGLGFTPQPAVPFHALQQRIQGPWADVVAVSPKLREHPLPNHRMFSRMMENVHLPEAEQDFARQELRVGRGHSTPL